MQPGSSGTGLRVPAQGSITTAFVSYQSVRANLLLGTRLEIFSGLVPLLQSFSKEMQTNAFRKKRALIERYIERSELRSTSPRLGPVVACYVYNDRT